MYKIIAKNDKQICLYFKLIYAENVKGSYEVIKTANGKFAVEFEVDLEEDVYLKLLEYYENITK